MKFLTVTGGLEKKLKRAKTTKDIWEFYCFSKRLVTCMLSKGSNTIAAKQHHFYNLKRIIYNKIEIVLVNDLKEKLLFSFLQTHFWHESFLLDHFLWLFFSFGALSNVQSLRAL